MRERYGDGDLQHKESPLKGTTFLSGSRKDEHTDCKVEIRQPVVQCTDTSSAWTACCNKLSLLCKKMDTERGGQGRDTEGEIEKAFAG